MTFTVIIATALLVAGAMVLFIFYLTRRDAATLLYCLKAGQSGSHWALASGGESDIYYDFDGAASDPKVAKKLADYYEDSIAELRAEIGRVDKLAFIEKRLGPVGAISLKDLLVQRTQIPAVIVRPRRRLDAGKLKGPIQPGDVVILVSDVATIGATMLEAVDALQAGGASVKGAVVFLVRDEAAKQA